MTKLNPCGTEGLIRLGIVLMNLNWNMTKPLPPLPPLDVLPPPPPDPVLDKPFPAEGDAERCPSPPSFIKVPFGIVMFPPCPAGESTAIWPSPSAPPPPPPNASQNPLILNRSGGPPSPASLNVLLAERPDPPMPAPPPAEKMKFPFCSKPLPPLYKQVPLLTEEVMLIPPLVVLDPLKRLLQPAPPPPHPPLHPLAPIEPPHPPPLTLNTTEPSEILVMFVLSPF